MERYETVAGLIQTLSEEGKLLDGQFDPEREVFVKEITKHLNPRFENGEFYILDTLIPNVEGYRTQLSHPENVVSIATFSDKVEGVSRLNDSLLQLVVDDVVDGGISTERFNAIMESLLIDTDYSCTLNGLECTGGVFVLTVEIFTPVTYSIFQRSVRR